MYAPTWAHAGKASRVKSRAPQASKPQAFARYVINTQNHQIQFMQGYLGDSHTHYCYDDPCAEYCAHHGSRRNRHLLFGAQPNNPHGCTCH